MTYTAGAGRAAAACKAKQIWPETWPEIISRETHDAEMLEALQRISKRTCGCFSSTDPEWHHDSCTVAIAKAAVAKVEAL